MSGYSVSLVSTGRYGTEKSALYLPRRIDPTKRAIIFAHGAGGDGSQTLDWKSQSGLCQAFGKFAQAGFVILSGDWGGQQTYGNDTEVAAMEAGWAWMKTQGFCATDKVILTGASMGTMSTSRFAADHPTWVAGLNLWIPAFAPDNLRDTNALGTRDLVNAAWGLTLGTYPATGGVLVPSRGQPIGRATEVAAIPTHAWYSTADTVAQPAYVDAYAAARSNVTKHIVSTTLDHSDAAILAADSDAILTFLQSVA